MLIEETQVRQIVEKMQQSPSGDNCQPWTFEWNQPILKIYHDPVRAKHPLNPSSIASMLALGCLIESANVAASEFQLKTTVQIFNLNLYEKSPWAEIMLESAAIEKNPLCDAIFKRETDRSPFKKGTLESKYFQKFEIFNSKLHFISEISEELLNFIVEAEGLLTDDPQILPATLAWARLSMKAANQTRDGLSWRNLGTRPWEVPLIPALRDSQNFLKIMKYPLGLQHSFRVREQLKTSAGLVCVSTPMAEQKNIIHAGELMMNAWLSLTSIGYGVQPLTLASAICAASSNGFMKLNKKWSDTFIRGEEIMKRNFSIPAESQTVWMFRTGISKPLDKSSRTFRKNLDEVLKFKT